MFPSRFRAMLKLKGVLTDRVGVCRGWRGAVFAAALVGGALLLRLWLGPRIAGAQFITFHPGVILATLACGTGPGLIAVALSIAASAFLLGADGLSGPEAASIAYFVPVAILDVAVISALLAANVIQTTALAQVAELNSRLRQDEAKFRDLIETAPDAMVIADRHERIVLINAQAESLFGFDRAELMGQSVDRLMPTRFHHHHIGRLGGFIAKARTRRMGNGEQLYGLRSDGVEFPIETNLSVIRSSDGDLVCSVIRDISRQKAAEERRTLLLHELNHRVKNTLTTVQAIASQTLSTAPDPDAFAAAFSARLDALSKGHNLLTLNDWTGAALRDLVIEQLRPYETAPGDRSCLEGPHVDLSPKSALALGMALSELATNSAKYGALSVQGGTVRIAWELRQDEDGRRLRLVWRDVGGPAVAPVSRRGFGSRLIERGLAHELGGSAHLTFQSAGVCCEIEFPLKEGAA